MEDCVSVAHVTFMKIVSQQSDSILMLLHNPSSEFTYNVTYTKLISLRKIFSNSRSSSIVMSVIWTPWDRLRLSRSILLINKLKILDVSSSGRWFPCKWRARARKRHKLSLDGCLVFSSYVRQLTVWFSSRGLGKTASLQPIGSSLSKAAYTVKLVNLWNLHLLCSFFLATRLYQVNFFWEKF